jgi:hypothetical protein
MNLLSEDISSGEDEQRKLTPRQMPKFSKPRKLTGKLRETMNDDTIDLTERNV